MATRRARDSKKKKWYSVIAPKEFHNKQLGDIPLADVKQMVNRRLKINLSNLLGEPKRQNTTVFFKVTGLQGEVGVTELDGYELSLAYIKRITRKATSKIEDSFTLKTKDGFTFRVKPVAVTRSRATKAVQAAIRKSIKEQLTQYFKDNNAGQIIMGLVTNRTQRELKNSLKKIMPIGMFEVRKLQRVL